MDVKHRNESQIRENRYQLEWLTLTIYLKDDKFNW